jgi:hypothetical protein
VGRVRDALIKMKTRKKPLTKTNLFDEMDMGKKEQGKFGNQSKKKYI